MQQCSRAAFRRLKGRDPRGHVLQEGQLDLATAQCFEHSTCRRVALKIQGAIDAVEYEIARPRSAGLLRLQLPSWQRLRHPFHSIQSVTP